jgi:phage-related baseplate assembly protein
MLEFTLSTALSTSMIVPKGTRATPGGNIKFATEDAVEIPAGALSATVQARCLQPGAIGNGFMPGQINRIIDPFPFTHTVQNTTQSDGGSDIEGWEPFRERVGLAPEGFSVAGPSGAYKYWARTANQLITDVSVDTPSSGVVEIIPLLQGGGIPTQAILDEVLNTCSDEHIRPLTDHVVVRAPEVVGYGIKLAYYISRRASSSAHLIQQRFDEAVGDFILWQKSAMGRDINPSQLTKMAMKSGIKRLEVECPVHTPLKYFEVGVCEDISGIAFGGLEDD